MKNVLIVTDLSFPKGSAMASRILSFCHLFDDLGYNVHVITGKFEDENVVYNTKIKESFYSYEIVKSNRSYRLQSYLGNENLSKRVDEYLNNNEVEFVFTTSLNANFKKVFDVVKKHNKKLILEQCEWFDPSSYTFKSFDPRYKTFENNIKNNFVKADGVIAISRLLYNYYDNLGIKTIRIPSILDMDNIEYSLKSDSEIIRLVYTGNSSKSKELLKPILLALSSDEKYMNNFRFDIYGMNDEGLLRNINNDKELLNKVKKVVITHNFVKQDVIKEILLHSDFQIFIRPNRKSSNAGFPTKLAETMSVGTPVFANDTGDISLYLKDSINGYICKDTNENSVKEVFDRILENKSNSLRKESRKTAEDNFNYKVYLEDVRKLIESL